jgi:enoyl-[acyl-carrier protein] reductase II
MFEGDMLEGELEIGQVSARIDKLISAEEVVKQTMREFTDSCKKMSETWK